jgi:Arc/MetJ-type ribon-helix-helix transcriptional regulator
MAHDIAMTITLSDEPESLLKRLLSAGRFASQEQAITEGLRLLASEETGQITSGRKELVEQWIKASSQHSVVSDFSTDQLLGVNRSEL